MTIPPIPSDDEMQEMMRPLVGEQSTAQYRRAFAWFAWSHATEPRDEDAAHFINAHGGAWPAWVALSMPGLASKVPGATAWLNRQSASIMQSTAANAARLDIRMTHPDDDAYPFSLYRRLGIEKPFALFYLGDLALLDATRPTVAVVGARAATSYGEHVTQSLVETLPHHVIVSGGAYGIDGAAHRAALALGQPTVAFLAGGVDRPYPAGHTDLLRRVGEHGLLISEVPPGSSPTKYRLLARNRLIAAAAHAVVAVEASTRSGTMSTVNHASRLHVPVAAVPGAVTSATSQGTNLLIREGRASLVTTGSDIREVIERYSEA